MGFLNYFKGVQRQETTEELTNRIRVQYDGIIEFCDRGATSAHNQPSRILDKYKEYRVELKYMTINSLLLLFSLTSITKEKKSDIGFSYAVAFMTSRLAAKHPLGDVAVNYFKSFVEKFGHPDLKPKDVSSLRVGEWYIRHLPYNAMPQEMGVAELIVMKEVENEIQRLFLFAIRRLAVA
ncbi:MAG: hypothetical protein H7343_11165 [Undibacterium sp.]|nr:hypothetical protein [Opitutaceae bacterium]